MTNCHNFANCLLVFGRSIVIYSVPLRFFSRHDRTGVDHILPTMTGVCDLSKASLVMPLWEELLIYSETENPLTFTEDIVICFEVHYSWREKGCFCNFVFLQLIDYRMYEEHSNATAAVKSHHTDFTGFPTIAWCFYKVFTKQTLILEKGLSTSEMN